MTSGFGRVCNSLFRLLAFNFLVTFEGGYCEFCFLARKAEGFCFLSYIDSAGKEGMLYWGVGNLEG